MDGAQPWRRATPAGDRAGLRGCAAPRPVIARSSTRFYAEPWARLAPLALASAEWLARAAGIATPARLASALAVTAGRPTERLVALCRAVGADTYLAGRDGARYMDVARFAAAGIEVLYQDYAHPEYAQLHGEFAPNCSGLDLLLTHGDEALAILRGGDHWSPDPPATP